MLCRTANEALPQTDEMYRVLAESWRFGYVFFASLRLCVRSVWNPWREACDPLWDGRDRQAQAKHISRKARQDLAKIAKKTWPADDLGMMRGENDGRFGSGGQIHSVAAQSVAVYAATTCIGSRRIGTSPLKATAARGRSSR